MPYCLSVDLGTTNVKAGVYGDDCALRVSASTPVPMDVSTGYCIQYISDFLKALNDTVKRLSFDLRKIDVISISGQMGGVVGIDKDFEPVTDWSGTVDTRSIGIAIPDREIVLCTCGSVSPLMAQKILYFEKNIHAKKYISLISFVVGKLTGMSYKDVFIPETILTWSGLSDLRKRCWSDELIELFNIDPGLLPRIAGSMELAGKLSPSVAMEFGLKPGIGVLVGVGDKIAGCIGAGAINDGDMVDEAASTPALTISTRSFEPDVRHGTWEIVASVDPDSYYALHYMPGAGIALNWFIDTFAQVETEEGKKKNKPVFVLLEEGAAAVPAGSDSLLCVNLLEGRALPYQPNIRGIFFGHKLFHTKRHFYRAFLESYAYEYKRCLDNLVELYPNKPIQAIKVVGGGGSQSTLLTQIKSDVLGCTYQQMDREDLGLLGCAIIGFTSIGVFHSLVEGICAKPVKEFFPDKKNEKIYHKMTGLYNRLINNSIDIFDELASG
jgi:xylulokinase